MAMHDVPLILAALDFGNSGPQERAANLTIRQTERLES